jgi:hypothetical protein
MEGMMSGDSPFQIRYLNPIIIFHDLFAWKDYPKWAPNGGDMIGSIASIEINWSISENMAFYGQFVMNELMFPGLTHGLPSYGFMAGVQYAHTFNSWGSVFFLEVFYTDPYLSILSSPFGSFIQMDRLGNYYYIGYPRDTVSVSAGANFFNNDTLRLSTNLSWIASGIHNKDNEIIWNWENNRVKRSERTPSGDAEHQFILSLGAGWKASEWIFLNLNLTGIYSHNNNNYPGKTAFGGQAQFSVSFRY